MEIQIKLMTETAKVPERKSKLGAGYDLYADIGDEIARGSFGIISTGVSVAIPPGYYGRIAPRSGLAAAHGIDVLGGVIDSDYRGELKVILSNPGPTHFMVHHGDRIAQLIIEKCHDVDFVPVFELPATERGKGGLGSTGR